MGKDLRSTRLNRWLALHGYGSRRSCDDLIATKRVKVNAQLASAGMAVVGTDKVEVDGRLVVARQAHEPPIAFVYHKPTGVICSERDDSRRPLARPLALAALQQTCRSGTHKPTWHVLSRQRWLMVGRLDCNSSGLLLFVNDGHFCQKLMHPSSNIPRRYRVRVGGELKPEQLATLLTGIDLDNQRVKMSGLKLLKSESSSFNRWFEVEIHRGIYREIRRMFASIGGRVNKLHRTQFAKLKLAKLKQGGARLLSPEELQQLMAQANYHPEG